MTSTSNDYLKDKILRSRLRKVQQYPTRKGYSVVPNSLYYLILSKILYRNPFSLKITQKYFLKIHDAVVLLSPKKYFGGIMFKSPFSFGPDMIRERPRQTSTK